MDKNKIKKLLLILIILTSICLRFYRLEDYMTFLGDEGRDALVVKRILVDHKFTLLGPATSIGNMYLGPLYYYFMIIPMALSGLNPLGPAMMVALFGVITVFLVYKITKEWFGEIPAFVASSLYAVSPSVIANTRSSWNPNPMPLFSLILVYSLYKTLKGNPKWFAVTLAMLAVVLQLHYMSLFLIPLIVLFWVLSFKINKDKLFRKNLITFSAIGIALFLILFGPFILFEIRHGFINTKALIVFIKENQDPNMYQRKTDFNPLKNFSIFIPIWSQVFHRLLPQILNKITVIISLASLIAGFYLVTKSYFAKKLNLPLFTMMSWMVIGIFGVSFYKGVMNDHYIGFLFPAPFILFGFLLTKFLKSNKVLISLITLVMVLINIRYVDIFVSSSDWQLRRTKDVTQFIIAKAENKPFNFALISNSNYEDPYIFFFEILGSPPVETTQKIEDTLFVVCEGECQPVGHPKWGIASFGWSKIDKEWQLDGRKVYKLVHYE
jgi:4-amino-4-deoxy-L-arabinose transferase-like glycosyltransferase